jgi:hypothetical protein
MAEAAERYLGVVVEVCLALENRRPASRSGVGLFTAHDRHPIDRPSELRKV